MRRILSLENPPHTPLPGESRTTRAEAGAPRGIEAAGILPTHRPVTWRGAGVRRILAPLLASTLLAACGGGASPTELTGTVLDPPFEVSSTPLVDTGGAAYSLTTDTDKDLTLVFFGYTNCPDICGQVMATLAGTLARLDDEQKERLDVVFVTTDPARDDKATVKSYVDAFDPTITGLTGDLDDIVEVGRSMAVGVDKGERLPSGGYEVTHGTQVIGIDASDEAPVYWNADVSQAQLAHDVTAVLDGGLDEG